MDSGLEERKLPSIRRSQMFLIYRNGGVVNPETFGQIACAARLSEGWRPYGQVPCEVRRPRKNKVVLPIRHHTSIPSHGGLMARYDRPSHPLAVPSISPYSIFFQGDWSFEATATMTWMCFQSAIKHLFPLRRGGVPFLNPPIMYNIVVCVGQVLLLNLTLRTAVNQPIQICLVRLNYAT